MTWVKFNERIKLTIAKKLLQKTSSTAIKLNRRYLQQLIVKNILYYSCINDLYIFTYLLMFLDQIVNVVKENNVKNN